MECKPQFRRAYRFLILLGSVFFNIKAARGREAEVTDCISCSTLVYSVLQIYRDKAESPYYRLYDILLLKNAIFSQ